MPNNAAFQEQATPYAIPKIRCFNLGFLFSRKIVLHTKSTLANCTRPEKSNPRMERSTFDYQRGDHNDELQYDLAKSASGMNPHTQYPMSHRSQSFHSLTFDHWQDGIGEKVTLSLDVFRPQHSSEGVFQQSYFLLFSELAETHIRRIQEQSAQTSAVSDLK